MIQRITLIIEWFFHNLKASFGESDDFVIVSDKHASIPKSIRSVNVSAKHGLCVYHLLKNLKDRHKSKLLDHPFDLCTRAYTVIEFEFYMR